MARVNIAILKRKFRPEGFNVDCFMEKDECAFKLMRMILGDEFRQELGNEKIFKKYFLKTRCIFN